MTIDNVIYIDSDVESRNQAREYFTGTNGFRLDEAANYAEALEKIKINLYNLIITDDFKGLCFGFFFGIRGFYTGPIVIISDRPQIRARAKKFNFPFSHKIPLQENLARIVNSHKKGDIKTIKALGIQ